MSQLLKWEFRRTFVSLKFVIFFSFIMIAAIFYMLVGIFDGIKSGVEFMFFSLSEMSTLVYLIGAVAAGMLITQCFNERTVQLSVMAGYSRIEVLISKFSSFLFFLIILIAIPTLAVTLITSLIFGWGDTAVGIYSGMFLTVLLVNAAFMSIYVPISFAVKNLGASIGVNCAVIIILNGLVQGLIHKEGLHEILSFTPAGQTMLLYMDFGSGNLIKSVIVSIITIILMFAVTYIKFGKEELK